MKREALQFFLLKKNVLLVDWPERIDEQILASMLCMKKKLEVDRSLIQEVSVSYHTLTIIFDDRKIGVEDLKSWIQVLQPSCQKANLENARSWEIPVCYEASFGWDLEELAAHKALSTETLIQLHTQTDYTLHFIGFLPGFMYLGGMDERLKMPRRKTPRTRIEQGAVAIGGKQTGVYPQNSPGGWHVIGKTPIRFFDPTQPTPCFAQAGDNIRFCPVSKAEFGRVEQAVQAGTYQLHSFAYEQG